MKNSETSSGNGLSTLASDQYRFGQFVLDTRRRALSRDGSTVLVTPKALDVLIYLVENPNRLVTKEEMLQAVWGDTFVEEGNLTQYISHLRKALGDNATDDRLIVTIARKGYQFTSRVAVVEPGAAERNGMSLGTTTESSIIHSRPVEFPTEESASESPPSRFRVSKWLVSAALLLTAGASVFWLYRSHGDRVTLSPEDTIVLADVKNETSDPAFTDALHTVLRYAFEQTPYLNTLGIDKVYGTLAELKLPPATQLTPELARRICLRSNSRLVIAPSIADAGNGYRIGLDAAECRSGRIVAKIRQEVPNRNQVVHALGAATVQLRRKLGEPAASLARFNKPMDEALSSSVDALQVGTQGYKHHIAGDIEGAIPYYKRALELDPNLAPTYEGLALAYDQIGEWRLAQSAYTKAYELRTRMTEPSRLEVEYLYYAYATGEREKALSVVTQTVQTFPRNVYARMNLAGCLEYLGQPARAVDEMREAARLQPTALSYSWLASYSIHAEMLDEARAVLDDAIARKLDSTELQMDRIRLAFLQNDQRTMQQFWNQTASRRDAYLILFMRSDVEEYYGRFRRGRELNQQALRMAPAAEWRREVVLLEAEPRDALWAAETGDSTQSREITAAALARVTNRDQRAALALAAARAGDIELARQLADALAREASANTLIQNYHLPTIRAAIKLEENDPAGVIAALRPSLKYELSMNDSFNGLYPAYLRGLAYLQLGNRRLAAAEFQKLMDHKGLVGRDVIGALAYLQMARAQKMTGDEASARKWYEQFLALWKDADPNIPILKQAKAEYARLPK